jgi:hypothetical protein
METVFFSEMLVSTCLSTWCHNPEEQHRHPHYCENFKSHSENIWLVGEDHLFDIHMLGLVPKPDKLCFCNNDNILVMV